MPWVKGQSGNPHGRPKKQFSEVLQRAIVQDDGKRLRMVIEKLLDKAAEGEPWAVKELADRLEGKPAQSVQLSGDEDNPIQVVEWLVKTGKQDD